MRAFSSKVTMVAPALLALAVGCRTPAPPPPVAPAPPDDPPAEALALYARALLHEFRNETAEALALYTEAVQSDPDDERLNVRTSTLLMRQRRMDEAVALMRRWSERRPGDPLRLRWLARVQTGAERFEDAAATYRLALKADPAGADSAAELAALQIRRDDGAGAAETLAAAADTARPALPLLRAANDVLTWAEARENPAVRETLAALLDRFAKRAETDSETQLTLGNLYRRLNRPADAGAAFERASALAPGDERAAVLAALMMAAGEREAEALEFAERAVRRVRQPTDLLRLIADLRVRAAGRATEPAEARAHRDAAIAALRRVLTARPDDAALRMALGELLLLTDRAAEALREFRRVEAADPEMKRRLALRFAAAGDDAAAIERLKALAVAEPNNSQVHHFLAELHIRRNERDNAIAAFRATLAGDAPDGSAYVRLAALLALDDTDAAMETLRAGQLKHPADLRIAEARAQTHLLRREFGEARAAFEWIEQQFAAEEPGGINPAFWVRSAIAFQQDGKREEAVERLQRAMQTEPLALELFVRLSADPEAREDDRARTREVLRALDARRPDVLSALYAGLFENFVKNYREAITAFETAVERARDNPESAELLKAPFYFWFGMALERDERIERAAEMFLKCIELDADHHEAQNYLAYMWADRGLHLDRALELVRQALTHEPENAAYLDTLGWIFFRQGRAAEALVELQRALALMPDEYEVQDHVGDVLHALGRTEEALPHWSRAFVLKPDEAKIGEKLERHGVDIEPLRREAEQQKLEQDRQRRINLLDGEDVDDTPGPDRPIPGLDLDREELEQLEQPDLPL